MACARCRAAYRDHAVEFWQAGQFASSVDYEPAESTTALYGGNFNWRGPVWFPVNYLIIAALERFARRFGDDLKVEFPRGSGTELTLHQIAIELARRLVAIFLDDIGRRPVFGGEQRFQGDAAWHEALLFHEDFNGDDGAGLGAPPAPSARITQTM